MRVMYPGFISFGLCGAIFSANLKVINIETSARIPEMTLAVRVTLLRLLLGAGAAVVIFVLVNAQLAALVSESLAGVNNVYTIYLLSFAAGFSERLVLKAIDTIAK